MKLTIDLERWIYPALLIALALVLLTSCGPSKEEIDKAQSAHAKKALYRAGEIIYIKPDSTKAVILNLEELEISACGCTPTETSKEPRYYVRTSKGGEYIQQSLIYTPASKETEY